MKKILGTNYVLYIIAIISAAGLWILSNLTIQDYSYDNEDQYIIAVNDGMVEELETIIRYGIQLERYQALTSSIKNAAKLLEKGCIIVMENSEGQVIASSSDEDAFSVSLDEYRKVEQNVVDPSDESVAGILYTYYPKSLIKETVRGAGRRALAGSIVIVLLMIVLCRILSEKKGMESDRLIRIIVIGIIFQGIFLTVNYSGTFVDSAYRNIEGASTSIAQTFNSLGERGVKPGDISDLEEYLNEKVSENKAIEKIKITKDAGVNVSGRTSKENQLLIPIKDMGVSLLLIFNISYNYIRISILQMILMFAATIILAVIVMKESLGLSYLLEYRKSPEFSKPVPKTFDSVARALRYGTFLSVTFDYLCMSYSALLIKEWNQETFGISPIFAAALSISVCSFASILGTLTMPYISRHISGRGLMIISSVVMIGADFIAFITVSPMILVLMRFLAGVGSAGMKQIRYIEIAQGYSTEKERAANLTAMNNGVIGGLLCGMGLGSVVAGTFGYQMTFLVACVGNILYLLFEFFCIPWDALHEGNEKEEHTDNLALRVVNVFKSTGVWAVLISVVIPQYMLLMVIVSLIPGRIQSLALPGVVLTYSNLINGIAGLYIGEWVYKRLEKKLSAVKIQGVMVFFGAVSLFVLDLPVFVTFFILVSAVLTGFVDGIGTPVSTELFLSRRELVVSLSETEGLMLYSIIGSFVMMIAPFICELCAKSILWMYGCAFILLLMSVALLFRHNKKNTYEQKEKNGS